MAPAVSTGLPTCHPARTPARFPLTSPPPTWTATATSTSSWPISAIPTCSFTLVSFMRKSWLVRTRSTDQDYTGGAVKAVAAAPGGAYTTSDHTLILLRKWLVMPHHPPRLDDSFLTRRELLRRGGMGFGMLGLTALLADDALLIPSAQAATTEINPLAPKKSHFAGKAKRIVHLFMNGGPSHVDTFDPKPMLDKWHGKPMPAGNLRTERKTAGAMRSPFKFQRHGKSGIEVSEIFQQTASCIDDLCVIRSMHADVPNHEPSLMLMNCGDARLPRPSMGAWVTYGLGSENQNLPGFIAMCPGGYPIVATQNWRSAFLPGTYQGTYIDTQHTDIQKLIENIRNNSASLAEQRRQLDLVRRLNEQHWERRQRDVRLEARIQSFELAFRMQTEAADVFDIRREPQAVRDWYGDGVQ